MSLDLIIATMKQRETDILITTPAYFMRIYNFNSATYEAYRNNVCKNYEVLK